MPWNPSDFDQIASLLGEAYQQLVEATKREDSWLSPNDNPVGVIGEWRAIQAIREQLGVDARKASSAAAHPDDLVIHYQGREHFISVKATTEFSKSGQSGVVRFTQARWDWMLCIRLDKSLRSLFHFWIPRAVAEELFTSHGAPLRFSWKKALRYRDQYPFPDWYKKDSGSKAA